MTYDITEEMNNNLLRAIEHQKKASELISQVCKRIKTRETKKEKKTL